MDPVPANTPLRNISHKIALAAEIIGIVLLVVMSAITFLQVVMRFGFDNPTSWSEELSIVCMTWLGYLGIAVAIRERSHMTVDYFVGLLPILWQKRVEKVNDTLILAFHGGMIYYGLTLMSTAEGMSLPATDIPMSGVYAVLVVGGSLNALFGFLQLSGVEPSKAPVVEE